MLVISWAEEFSQVCRHELPAGPPRRVARTTGMDQGPAQPENGQGPMNQAGQHGEVRHAPREISVYVIPEVLSRMLSEGATRIVAIVRSLSVESGSEED